MMSVPDLDLRVAAFQWLAETTRRHGDELTWKLLSEGFPYRGRRVPLVSQKGIWKPAICRAALSIMTSPDGPYEDLNDEGRIVYRYRGRDPDQADNRALRAAMTGRAPLVYLYKIEKGVYLATWPLYVIAEDRSRGAFVAVFDDAGAPFDDADRPVDATMLLDADPDDGRRRYVTAAVLRRLHQGAFRRRVIAAYRRRCALCRLRHEELLDAAHIVPDAVSGPATVRNGVSLCKLHHAAFDRHFVGIRPDYVVEVRPEILRERDGPMLVHGLQRLHHTRIVLPSRADERPDPEFLERRFERFRNG